MASAALGQMQFEFLADFWLQFPTPKVVSEL